MKRIRQSVTGALLVIGFALSSMSLMVPATSAVSADEQLCAGSGGTYTGGKCTTPGKTQTVESLFGTITKVLLFIVGAVAVIMLIIGGIKYVLSGGDNAAVTSAKNTILYAVVGVVIAFAGYAIVDFVVDQITKAPAPAAPAGD